VAATRKGDTSLEYAITQEGKDRRKGESINPDKLIEEEGEGGRNGGSRCASPGNNFPQWPNEQEGWGQKEKEINKENTVALRKTSPHCVGLGCLCVRNESLRPSLPPATKP